MKKTFTILFFVAIAMILFSSCAHVQPIQACVEGTKVYGFWNGLWHGMIVGFTFIGSLFDHTIAIYAVHNNGAWYNFGFILGVGGLCGGGYSVRSRN
jgi:hypothetical protein